MKTTIKIEIIFHIEREIYYKFYFLIDKMQTQYIIEWPVFSFWGFCCCFGMEGVDDITQHFGLTHILKKHVFLNREKNRWRQKREQILLLWITCSSYFKHFWSVLRSIWYCLNLVPCRLSPIWIEKPCRCEEP